MALRVENTALTIPQPQGEPIQLGNRWNSANQFLSVYDNIGQEVPAHFVAMAVSLGNSMGIPNDEIADMAADLHSTDTLFRDSSTQPIIYRGFSSQVVALTPEAESTGLSYVQQPFPKATGIELDVSAMYSIDRGISSTEKEGTTKIAEDVTTVLTGPAVILASSDSRAVERFFDHGSNWEDKISFKPDLILGQEAVDAFLKAQASKELVDRNKHRVIPSGVKKSWAMLASAGLQALGYPRTIGGHGDFVNAASVEALADFITVDEGYLHQWKRHGQPRDTLGELDKRREGSDNMLLRRLAGVELDEISVRAAGLKATAKVLEARPELERGNIETGLIEAASRIVKSLPEAA